jgi:hypothetical protein
MDDDDGHAALATEEIEFWFFGIDGFEQKCM